MAAQAVAVRASAQARNEAWWMFPAMPMLAAAIAFAWTLHGELQRMYGMTSEAWDLAYDQQVIWSITQGDWFYSSFARANFLGVHLELVFVVLAAIEKFWPSPTVLLIFSSAGLAATAPAAYLFFRAILPADRAESPWLAVAMAAPLPFWAAVQESARDFFHPENMALPLALLAAWAGIRGHRIAMWCLCVLTLTCKEDQVYTVGVIALLMRVYGAQEIRKHWRFILYLAVFWLLIGTGVIQQHLRAPNGYTDFVYYGWLIGLNPAIHVTPLAVLEALVRPEALLMVAGIIASMAALPVLAPRWLLLMIPPYLANVLSAHPLQNQLQLHYVMLLMFPLVVAGGVGARAFLERRSIRPAWALVAAAPALLLGYGTGRFPPSLLTDIPWAYDRPNAVAELRTATAVIPSNAPVNADAGLDVWLANRHQINDFPDMLDNGSYVVIDQEYWLGSNTNRDARSAAVAALASSGRRLLYDDGRFQVWSPVGD
ncbi:MAG TPA: DUF2079 domain-containing protein [Candidatus Dormibacteraeota bacterium]|nr:DUF2079 domain-containing protein [Candidatus Dormibacteraeota bacterium]